MHSVGDANVARFYVGDSNQIQSAVDYKLGADAGSGRYVNTSFESEVTQQKVAIKLKPGLTVDDLMSLTVSIDGGKKMLAKAVFSSAGIFFRPEQVLAIIIAGIYAKFY